MSGIAALYNVPGTPEETASWSFAHAAHHRDINRILFQVLGITLAEFVLDPFDPNNIDSWIYQHQEMHNSQNALLSIAGFDLSEVEWKDKKELSGWIYLNAVEHNQAADILEIG